MTEFMMLIGIPASGKSSLAKELAEEKNAIIVSSDTTREMFNFQDGDEEDNKKVFSAMINAAKAYLEKGLNVIFDATNISRKKRIAILQQLKYLKDVKKHAYYVNTAYETAVRSAEVRERHVPKGVVKRMFMNLQMPIYEEGWDKITIIRRDKHKYTTQERMRITKLIQQSTEHDELMEALSRLIPDIANILNYVQDSTYHSFSVSRHTFHVYENVKDNTQDMYEIERLNMLWVAVLHDIGKRFCKSFKSRQGEATRHANFIGHENVGAQLACDILKSMDYSDDRIIEICKYVQLHMVLLNASEKGRNRWKKFLGEESFANLEMIREADVQAH
ncbi:ATP-binding protein [Bacillus thuringiensis]|uniref:ATP-binding protein n=1 Tax=Bacillus thuringiensis TaxID=1428 RepID=UPI000BF536B6|nr:ATP-binding protein [Bacillus thuringiensis]PFC28523.1 hypothetical protein CN299_19835 [Bacillus thuringiensis]